MALLHWRRLHRRSLLRRRWRREGLGRAPPREAWRLDGVLPACPPARWRRRRRQPLGGIPELPPRRWSWRRRRRQCRGGAAHAGGPWGACSSRNSGNVAPNLAGTSRSCSEGPTCTLVMFTGAQMSAECCDWDLSACEGQFRNQTCRVWCQLLLGQRIKWAVEPRKTPGPASRWLPAALRAPRIRWTGLLYYFMFLLLLFLLFCYFIRASQGLQLRGRQ